MTSRRWPPRSSPTPPAWSTRDPRAGAAGEAASTWVLARAERIADPALRARFLATRPQSRLVRSPAGPDEAGR
ncbi:hypothetical protein [Luteimicrobium album]|uniref:hypothetical protein n=1 Tax=Luteimicrobium album TaxID=1054550 RepID=UPI0024E054C1|nr:hypothetical protein [Luteimicrobium album]